LSFLATRYDILEFLFFFHTTKEEVELSARTKRKKTRRR
jgi:hypothetical protein